MLATPRRSEDFPRAVYVIDALFCIALVGAYRFGERALADLLARLNRRGSRRRTLIVGAGRSGRSLLRELRETPGEQPIGFVDDDPRLRTRRLQGVPVLGPTTRVDAVLAATRPDAVLVTIPDAPRETLDALVSACVRAGVPCSFVRRHVSADPHQLLGATE